ncbi:unnamed protein product [Cyprideis torosa]|uniref:ubiquitinyl hydrolase 1 n=1 Tax=Cyprideis torosa TaxID=163714 RepID=A0A7R8WFY5_9CRUS|nr:unnamed protein product [Cyprideis torosa]CAG0894685.1 unnamed protein product [Cyprideis torosa]
MPAPTTKRYGSSPSSILQPSSRISRSYPNTRVSVSPSHTSSSYSSSSRPPRPTNFPSTTRELKFSSILPVTNAGSSNRGSYALQKYRATSRDYDLTSRYSPSPSSYSTSSSTSSLSSSYYLGRERSSYRPESKETSYRRTESVDSSYSSLGRRKRSPTANGYHPEVTSLCGQLERQRLGKYETSSVDGLSISSGSSSGSRDSGHVSGSDANGNLSYVDSKYDRNRNNDATSATSSVLLRNRRNRYLDSNDDSTSWRSKYSRPPAEPAPDYPGADEENHLTNGHDRTISSTTTTADILKSPGLVGLRNLMNTCYLNTVIQCLSNTPPFLDYVRSGKPLKDVQLHDNLEGKARNRKELVLKIHDLFCKMWDTTYEREYPLSPAEVKASMGRLERIYQGTEQQDAQECLGDLLNAYHAAVNRRMPKPSGIIMPEISDSLGDYDKGMQTLQNFLRYDDSPISEIFVSLLKSTLFCQTCKNRSKCAKCGTPQKATKKIEIFKFPQILVVQLKRFAQSRKIRTFVDFPVDQPLDLSRYAAEPPESSSAPIYNLYAVAYHHTPCGSLESGHYTAACKNRSTQMWFVFDDKNVRLVEPDKRARRGEDAHRNIKTSDAYLLFYEKQN